MRYLILAVSSLAIAATSSAYVREFDTSSVPGTSIPIAWVKDRTVVMQLSLGGPQLLSDGFHSFNESARDALNVWNAHLAHLTLSSVMNSPVKPAEGDYEMSVEFANSIFGEASHFTL